MTIECLRILFARSVFLKRQSLQPIKDLAKTVQGESGPLCEITFRGRGRLELALLPHQTKPARLALDHRPVARNQNQIFGNGLPD
jgi:hypothetical protein